MINDINVKIHIANIVKLGGKNQWDWRQSNAAGPYWRLYWNRIPGAFVKTGAVETELTPDRVVLLSPGTEYGTRTIREVHHFYVHFSVSEPFSRVLPQLFCLPFRELTAMATELAEAVERSSDTCETDLKMQIFILTALLRLPKEAVPPPHSYDERIMYTLQLLEACPSMTNPELAAAVNMSVNSFQELFRNATGEPPQTYSRRKRLADAAKMLHFGQATIDEIAIAAGFCDRYHFSRAFKTEYGLPPATYRLQAKRLQAAGEVTLLPCGSNPRFATSRQA